MVFEGLFQGGKALGWPVGMPRSCLLGGAKGEFEAGLGNCSNEHPYSGDVGIEMGGNSRLSNTIFKQGNAWHNAPWRHLHDPPKHSQP